MAHQLSLASANIVAAAKLGDRGVHVTCDAQVAARERSSSTSVGGSSPRSGEEDNNEVRSAGLLCVPSDSLELPEGDYPSPFSVKTQFGLPDYDYPFPLVIRNTFIDTDMWQPSSLCGFVPKREIQSCPASGFVASPRPKDEIEDACEIFCPLYQPEVIEGEAIGNAVAATILATPTVKDASTVVCSAAVPITTCVPDEIESELDRPTQLPTLPPPPTQPPMLVCMPQLQELPPPPRPPALLSSGAVPEPQLGSPGLPTIGSASHYIGTCRPCAFLHTKGCANGVECMFCHLCQAGEKKRRRKEKVTMMRAAKNQGQLPTCGYW